MFIALEGDDYSVVGDFQIVFGSDVSSGDSRCAQLQVEDDSILEEMETFAVSIVSVTPAVNGDSSQSVTVQIEDDESMFL